LERVFFTDDGGLWSVSAIDLVSEPVRVSSMANVEHSMLFEVGGFIYLMVQDGSRVGLLSVDLSTGGVKYNRRSNGTGGNGLYWIEQGDILYVNTYLASKGVFYGRIDNDDLLEECAPVANADGCIICTNGDFLVSKDYDIYRSTDKGVTWGDAIPSPVRLGRSVKALDQLTGALYALGSASTLYKSVDNGETWVLVFSAENSIHSLTVSNDKIFMSDGLTSDVRVYYSPDGGESWSVALSGSELSDDVYCVYPSENDSLYVGCINGVMHQFSGKSKIVGGAEVAIMSEVN
jgi:hypothetical protein